MQDFNSAGNYAELEQAWTDFFHQVYPSFESMTPEEYHERYKTFVAGALCGLNVLSTRAVVLRKGGASNHEAFTLALRSTVNNALNIVESESGNNTRKKS